MLGSSGGWGSFPSAASTLHYYAQSTNILPPPIYSTDPIASHLLHPHSQTRHEEHSSVSNDSVAGQRGFSSSQPTSPAATSSIPCSPRPLPSNEKRKRRRDRSADNEARDLLIGIWKQVVSQTRLEKARRVAATERERNRSQKLNVGFDRLRMVLPEVYQGRKLSKHETLMLAQVYIHQLTEILQETQPVTKQ